MMAEMEIFPGWLSDEGLDMEVQIEMPHEHERSIFRIPLGIREANMKAFEPETISIGPYHHVARKSSVIMVSPKRRYRKKFFARNPNKAFNDYFMVIKSSIGRAKKCYSEEVVNMTDDEFVKLLVLDGIFIVELLLMLRERRFDPWEFGFPIGDLLKMENQVPFFVLRDLYNLSLALPSNEAPSITDLAYNFAERVAKIIFGAQVKIEKPLPEQEFQHLLHFCHYCFFAGGVHQKSSNVNRIPTAQELTKAGVKIKLAEKVGIWEVTFSRGVLEMTIAEFNANTYVIIHNLIALEKYYPPVGVYVTAYSYFLDKLIDTSADVLLLRQLGVVHNELGSDENLAILANNLCHTVAGTLSEPMARMFKDVNNYCSHRWRTWLAMLVKDYFGNPWRAISVIAAVILLLLTGLQAVFAVLSYVKQSVTKPGKFCWDGTLYRTC